MWYENIAPVKLVWYAGRAAAPGATDKGTSSSR